MKPGKKDSEINAPPSFRYASPLLSSRYRSIRSYPSPFTSQNIWMTNEGG